MNSKAVELGCKNTHFVNPNGIHNEEHYSSAYDLALIAKYAMRNETFREIVSYSSYKLPPTELYPEDNRIFANTNDMLVPYSNYYYKYATGIKTGYTSAAGYCLVASAEKNNLNLISIIFGSENNEKKYTETKSLFEYGFNNYSIKQISKKGEAAQTIKIKNATRNTKNLNAILENNISAIVKNGSTEAISPEIEIKDKLKAPIKKGDVIGTITYNIEGISYTSNLIANNDVKPSYLFVYILLFVIVCWLIIKLLEKIKNNKKNYRKN